VKEKILLVTSVDDTFQQPLLQNEGYQVHITAAEDALSCLRQDEYRLVLITTETSVPKTIELCEQMKSDYPNLGVALIAQRAEYIPSSHCIDAVIRSQYSPQKFLAAIRRLIDGKMAEGATLPNDEDID
jgi:CheY-like chemotaxis protein